MTKDETFDTQLKRSDELLDLIYDRLRRFSKAKFGLNDSLYGTELVHEAWLRIGSRQQWDSESHFFAAVCNAMRNATTDYLRKKHAIKRGGNLTRVTFESIAAEVPSRLNDIFQLSEALDELARQDERAANIVTFKFYCGMTESEIAERLGISRKTVTRDWAYSKLWLENFLSET